MSDSRSGFLFCLTNPHAIIDIFVVSFSLPQCYPQREVFFSRLSGIREKSFFYSVDTIMLRCVDVDDSKMRSLCVFFLSSSRTLLIFDRVQVDFFFRRDNCNDLVKVRDEG